MDFDLTEDRRMLSDTVTRYLADQYGIEHRNKVAYAAPYHDNSKWNELAELGVLAAFASEEAGGFGGTGFDISVVFEALGGAMSAEPMLGALMASRLLASAGAEQDSLLDGSRKYAVGISEMECPYGLEFLQVSASVKGDGHVLNGRKTSVYGGQVAETFLIAAMLDGKVALFEVAASDAEVVGYGMIDGGGAAEVLLDDANAKLLIADAKEAVQDALNAGIVALCSESLGVMVVAYDMLLDYLKTRKQFGVNIGRFQVLQHRTVDLLTEIEQARSIVIKAASELDGPDAARYCSMAKNLIGRAGRLVSEESIQMHGGIAMTWEYPASHYGKRLVMIDHQLGDTDFHLTQVMKG